MADPFLSLLEAIAGGYSSVAEILKGFGCGHSPLAVLIYLGVGGILMKLLWDYFTDAVPQVVVQAGEEETAAVLEGRPKFDWSKDRTKDYVPCWDPATMASLGKMPAMNEKEVKERIALAKKAQKDWAKSSFRQRKQLMKIILRYIVENSDTIAKVACRDSGKTMVDAMFGEVLVTCEKLKWTIAKGEKALSPEYRDSGSMNLHKTSRVEFVPVGVVGAIVPWNYPFHNVFNPLIASLFAGNAIVIKVSEYASWSTKFYGEVIKACLRAAGAPVDLVQIITGYGEAGNTVVTGGVDKVIFVGSVGVGKKVMEAASANLTPVVLELGGKDPFIVCDDADVTKLGQLACRGVFQNMGQNCAGPERFIVYDNVYDAFCKTVKDLVDQMSVGAPLASKFIDCGACCMPDSLNYYQALVDDAVSCGARVLCGGKKPNSLENGQFYPPTVLADVPGKARIAKEEIFGPIMCIMRVASNKDAEAVQIANNCAFGLSACAHSADQKRAAAILQQVETGMASVNDLEGTTYLSQSLPFGGVKYSGFDRFAGVEGLRGLCHIRSIVENRFSFIAPAIPAQIAYPSTGQGPQFCRALVRIMYGYGLSQKLMGVVDIIKASLPVSKKEN